MQALEDLILLPEQDQDALGTTATAREIAQQPATWRRTREIFAKQADRLRTFLEAAGVTGHLEQKPTVMLTGAGTSDYIGQTLALLLRAQWGCETQAIASTDLLLNMANYIVPGRRYLMISFSRSGESPEGVTVLKQALARYPEIAHLVVTCNQGGRMAELARGHRTAYAVVLADEVNDRGLAMTSSFTNMVVLGQCLAHVWTWAEYEPIFEVLVNAGEAFLPVAGAAACVLAEKRYKRVCVLGSGALTGVARESALKVLELTAGGVKTMAESVLGLRHGPMAALDAETLLVCMVSSESRSRKYEADLLREVGEKGIVAERVVVGPVNGASLDGCSEHFLRVANGVPDLYRPPVDVIFGQLLGLYSSLAHGLKPDAPSPHGVISRVVGEFQIYE